MSRSLALDPPIFNRSLQVSHSYTSASMRPRDCHLSKSMSCTPSVHRHGSRRTSFRLSVSPISRTRTPQPLAAVLWRSWSNLLLVGSLPLVFMWRSQTTSRWLLIASIFWDLCGLYCGVSILEGSEMLIKIVKEAARACSSATLCRKEWILFRW